MNNFSNLLVAVTFIASTMHAASDEVTSRRFCASQTNGSCPSSVSASAISSPSPLHTATPPPPALVARRDAMKGPIARTVDKCTVHNQQCTAARMAKSTEHRSTQALKKIFEIAPDAPASEGEQAARAAELALLTAMRRTTRTFLDDEDESDGKDGIANFACPEECSAQAAREEADSCDDFPMA